MFKKNHYVPVLKWKRGEQKALEFLSQDLKPNITPLIEIVDVPYDYVEDRPAKTIDEHLLRFGEQLENSWGIPNPVFVDPGLLDPEITLEDGSQPVRYLYEQANNHHINIIPVTGLNRSEKYQAEIGEIIKSIKTVCLRVEDDDLLEIETKINDFLDRLGTSPDQAHLILDFKYVDPIDEGKHIISLKSIIKTMPYLHDWRTFTLCCTSFPESLSSIYAGEANVIHRSERSIWNKMHELSNTIERIPTFGDYCIANPYMVDIDPRMMQMSANIRYTVDNGFLILKGRSIKKSGWEQLFTLAENLVKSHYYSGREFSWGDQFIYDCANKNEGPGNAEIWRRVGTNHHLNYIIKNLSSLYGS